MQEIEVNYLAVLVAAVASMGIGALWYSNVLFGKVWMKLMNLTPEKMEQIKKQGMSKQYAIAFLASLVMAFVLAHFVEVWEAIDIAGAFQLALWTWLGFVVTTMVNSILWEGKPTKLYLINVGHYFVGIFAMSIILVLWK